MAVVGRIASGKSALAANLAEELGALSLSPDDFGPMGGQRWTELFAVLDQHEGPAVVEGCRVPHGFQRRMRERPSFTILVRAPDELRAERLLARGERPSSISRLMAESEPAIRPDAVVARALGREDAGFARLVAAIRKQTSS